MPMIEYKMSSIPMPTIPLKSVWMNKGGHSSFGNAFNPLTTVSKLFAAKKLKAHGTSIAHFTFSSFASVKPPIASGACDLVSNSPSAPASFSGWYS